MNVMNEMNRERKKEKFKELKNSIHFLIRENDDVL